MKKCRGGPLCPPVLIYQFIGCAQNLSDSRKGGPYEQNRPFFTHRRDRPWPCPRDFIKADVGRTRLFLLQGKSRDSLRVGTRRDSLCAGAHQKKAVPNGTAFLFILGNRDYFIASSTATAQATVMPTIGLLPAPIRPIISTCAGTEEEPANCASPCILPMESVRP